MDWKTVITLLVTVLIALAGYLATYLNNLRIAQRKDRLERINRQLSEFYGPLFALVRTSTMTWDVFRNKCRPGKAFWGTKPTPTPEEAAAWRLWMSEVFMPLNLRMEKVIVERSDLLDEKVMPECLLTLCAHVSAYKAILKKWELKDFSDHVAEINFPREEILDYTQNAYVRVKEEQAELLGKPGRKVKGGAKPSKFD